MENINPFELLENNSETISHKTNSFEIALKNLDAVTRGLADVLDNTSDKIRILEKILTESKTNFPYAIIICKENQSILKRAEARHLRANNNNFDESISYYTEDWWTLSWEPDENSKNYRLFLISEKKEFCWTSGHYNLFEFDKTLILRKPLIEWKLEIRLRFAQHIVPFMNSFNKKLTEYKLSLNNEFLYDNR